MKPGHALIVGGGIGGTASAIALAQRGWKVEILEQAAQIAEVGAGVQIGPNGVKVLDALGVMDGLEPFVFEPEHIELRDGETGRKIFHLPMKGYAKHRWGARYLQVHRADLLGALSARLSALAPDAVILNAKAMGYSQDGAQASVTLADGRVLHAELIVGADGIHSALRKQMFDREDLTFTGNVAWRAVVSRDDLEGHKLPFAGCVWAGSGKHAVTTLMRGGSLVNFVGIVEQDNWREEGWSIPGDRRDALADFGAWDPALKQILTKAPQLYRWALFSRSALPHWSDGAVVLLGDAAHPMLPSMAQGAVQALEDAWVLAKCMDRARTVADANKTYFSRRSGRAQAVQKRSKDNLRLFHKRGLEKRVMFAALGLAGRINPTLLHRQQDWIYGFDATRAAPN